MQSIPQANRMEIFLVVLILIAHMLTTLMMYLMSKKIHSIELHSDFFRKKFITTLDSHGSDFDRLHKRVDTIVELVKYHNDRSLQALIERLDAKPITPKNNWDSIKEAFKGPVRTEKNE